MSAKYCLLIAFSFFFIPFRSQFFESQRFTLNWKNFDNIQLLNDEFIKIPTIIDCPIDLEKRLPLFSSTWKVKPYTDIDEYEITDLIYEDVAISNLYDTKIENIPDNVVSNFQYISNRNENEAFLTLIPLIKQNNSVKKIISFTLKYKVSSTNKPLSSKSSASNSVLSSGMWYKIEIDTTGVFKIDRTFLNDLGINPDNINPKNIQIYGNGGALLPYKIGDFRYDDLTENAIYVAGEEDEKFDANDYILFYAKGPESWKHNNSIATLKHIRNIYSDKAYYFIHIGNNLGRRIINAPLVNGVSTVTYQNFDDFLVYEKDEINLASAGQLWFGNSFFVHNQKTFNFNFTNADYSYPISIKTAFAAIASTNTQFTVKANNQIIYTLPLAAINPYSHDIAKLANGSGTTTINSDVISIEIDYNNNGNSAAKSYLDYIEIIGKKKLIANNKQFSFRNFDVINQSDIVSYQIQNASNIYALWDVTDYVTPKAITNQTSGNSFEFKANGGTLQEYIVLNSQDFYIPKKPADFKVANQNLHGLSNVDYIIVTQADYTENAEVLARYHRNTNQLNVAVVPLHQIYNEFGSGSPDITAIRDFVRHVYLQSNNRLKYLLLYGDASYDFKGIETDVSIVPTFQSIKSINLANTFSTDDFFGIVSDLNEGDLDNYATQSLDIAVGRIPFNDSNEANEINQKIINYYKTASFGDWRNDVLMIADDSDAPSDNSLQISQELLADIITPNISQVNLKKLWVDAYQQEVSSSGATYPEPINIINNSIEKGVLLIDYFGHGGEAGLSSEKLVTTNQIKAWNNFDRLNTFVVISCEFARFDNPKRPNTAGEMLIRNPKGGAVMEIATTREIYIHIGENLNKALIPRLLEINNENLSAADYLRRIKNAFTSYEQRFFVYFFGDPAMKLAMPKRNIKLTKINGVAVSQSLDTIKALSKISLDGIITDNNDVIDNQFNGEMTLTLFDKSQDKQTLSNDGIAPIMTFDTQDSKLFRGKAKVTNGQFHIEFVAPKDIRIAYGTGKLSFYAQNGINEKGGYNKDVIIGGINYDAPEDTVGPKITLYMNDTSFIDGGNTNQSPLLLAYLTDESGINTSFSAVDHDITAVLDNDQQNPLILNEYYLTNLDDYTKGTIEFRLRNLSIGHHTIDLKAYDTYNNVGNASINFVVVDDAKLILEHVLNYPNPFVNYTEFWFNHNKPNELLNVQIQIFTVSGKLVKTINQNIQNVGSLSREITWNGLDDFGQKIGKGVYIFKLLVKTQNNLQSEKIEKLVILQ